VRGWHIAVMVAAGAVGALATSGQAKVIPAALVIGAMVGGMHLFVGRGTARLLPAPEVPTDASPAERARLLRPYLRRWVLFVIVSAAAAIGLGFVLSGPSTSVAVYLALPFVLVLALLLIALRTTRSD
jgi:hypothetical protein